MHIHRCDNMTWFKRRTRFIQFIIRYGDRRITHKAIRWLRRLKHIEAPGHLIAYVQDGNRMVGFTAIGDYGQKEAIIVVHPQYRKQRVGEQLLRYTLQELPKVYTRVACDNIPSLRLCFSCGLVAYRLIKGPTQKPTLCLAGGDWQNEANQMTIMDHSSSNSS